MKASPVEAGRRCNVPSGEDIQQRCFAASTITSMMHWLAQLSRIMAAASSNAANIDIQEH